MTSPSQTQAGQKYEAPVIAQISVTLRPMVAARVASRQDHLRRPAHAGSAPGARDGS